MTETPTPVAPSAEGLRAPFGAPTKGTLLLRLLLVLLLVVADQWSKSAVFSALEGGPAAVESMDYDFHGHARFPVLDSLFGEHFAFMLSLNKGAAFGRFGDYPHILVGGRVLAVALLGWLLLRARRGEGLGIVALVLVLSGALGNLVDNLWTGPFTEGHPYGQVRDFLDVWFLSDRFGWDFHFHTFNVADACISVGAVFWILAGILHREPDPEAPAAEAGAAGATDS